jgi:hypothetical protein
MSLNSINRVVFVMEMRCVFCAIGTELPNINYMDFRLQIINIKRQLMCSASEHYHENITINYKYKLFKMLYKSLQYAYI